jgi:hypothetical protein
LRVRRSGTASTVTSGCCGASSDRTDVTVACAAREAVPPVVWSAASRCRRRVLRLRLRSPGRGPAGGLTPLRERRGRSRQADGPQGTRKRGRHDRDRTGSQTTRHYVSTDNAQVDGDQIMINGPATGLVTDWSIGEGSPPSSPAWTPTRRTRRSSTNRFRSRSRSANSGGARLLPGMSVVVDIRR